VRIALAVLGTVALVFGACFAVVLGVLAFTPTTACTPTTGGVCSYGQLPVKLAVFAVPGIVLLSVLATWAGALRRPRAAFPYVGAALVAAVFAVALAIAA
jgi:hypothetical protein